MNPLPFHIVDVFTTRKFAGNQLAVFQEATALSEEEMQALAQEMNFSEVTFIESIEPRDGGYDVRIFDPVAEMEFAGHPTLGTAHVLREHILDHAPNQISLNLNVGQIPVRVESGAEEDEYWMQQIPPTFTRELDHSLLASVLGMSEADLDSDYPVQVVSTGLPTAIVPVKSLSAIENIVIHNEYYNEFIDEFGELMLLCFAPETVEPHHDLHARVFAGYSNVPEDPATGSSNGCLSAYLIEHNYFNTDEIEISVEQGYEMGRPSQLSHRSKKTGDEIEVHIGGSVMSVAKGQLLD